LEAGAAQFEVSTWRASMRKASRWSVLSFRGTVSRAHNAPNGWPSGMSSGAPAQKRIRGALVTNELCAKRASSEASGTSYTSLACMACWQKGWS